MTGVQTCALPIFNTPHKPSHPYSEDGDDSACLSTNCIVALENLQKEATLYINGKRGVAKAEDSDANAAGPDAAPLHPSGDGDPESED